MVNSVLNEGVRGLQNSQRELQKAASDIARANVNPVSQAEQSDPQRETSLAPLQETQESSGRSIEESLVELRRQEQIFDANAKVVSVASETLGTLIDVQS